MKRILIIQDISVFGKTSGNVSLSIFSAMGIENVFAPVFINLSKWNDDFKSDLSCNFNFYTDYFVENKINFDGIFINGDFSESQIKNISYLADCCLSDDCFLFLGADCSVDLIKCFYRRSNLLIISLAKIADYLNLMEKNKFLNKEAAEDFIYSFIKDMDNDDKIYKKSLSHIIVKDFFINDKKSGIVLAETSCNYTCEEKNKMFRWFYHNNYNCDFYGLDDIFSAVVSGFVLNGNSVEKAIERGVAFTEKAVLETVSKPDHNWYGADFESILCDLSL